MMKKYLVITLVFFPWGIFAQKSMISKINSLPKAGVLLVDGWKFQNGDNPDYAKPDYDDNGWQDINPALDIHDSLPQISKYGIGWFRLHLSLDSSLVNRQLALVIQQSGASEIYLNGHKIQSFGIISADPNKIRAFDPLWKPVPISFKAAGEQLVAIRYAHQPKIFYTTIFETANPVFSVRIMDLMNAIDDYHENASRLTAFESLLFGIGIMIIILHLSFYFLYPSQKANLYFALFAFMFVLANVVQLVFYLYSNQVASKFYLGNITFVLFILGYVFILMAAYNFIGQKKDVFYYALLIFSIVAIILDAWPYNLGWKVGGPIQEVLVQLNIGRIAFISVKGKQRGAWIIATGAVCSVIFFVIFLSQGTFTNISFILSLPILRIFTYVMFNLSLPAATSIFLAFEFAFTNRILQQKLIEVNLLSRKNLEQEKEKQQILAVQNETLEEQVKERTVELKNSFENLKSTQSQLIQSEKMASLGELTAGIAHEIQNPLNFVNNFSEVNNELTWELQEALKIGDTAEAINISNNIIENGSKISQHGKRAAAIVKGMLQHSRSNVGEKESMDINILAKEYLGLAYHGFKAKEEGFITTIITDFDSSMAMLDMIPQDIGRVLLNLYNNSFYAVSKRKKRESESYEPTVFVGTKNMVTKVEITVKDNGNGISQKVIDKIFQPFFTTKPTGQGTGLGLSLSYDIVKAHGGEIRVESKEGEYTEFIVVLPC